MRTTRTTRVWGRLLVVGQFLLMAGCASLEGPEYAAYDPNEAFNRPSYAVTDWVDRNAVAPVARGYQHITPGWLRQGISNFFSNLREIDSALNGFLQGKPKSGATDLARILINSTAGIGGLFDVAGASGIVDQEEDLGQTLAVAGITRSRYLYVPLVGPSTNRDVPSLAIRALIPSFILGGAYAWWIGGIDLINSRAELLTATEVRDASALDPYAFTREAYYQRRKFLIFDGDPPMDDFFDEFDDPDDE